MPLLHESSPHHLEQGVGTPLHMICVAYIHSLDGIIIIEINLASSYVACTCSVGAIKDFIMFIYQVLYLLLNVFLFWVHKTHYNFNGGHYITFQQPTQSSYICRCMCWPEEQRRGAPPTRVCSILRPQQQIRVCIEGWMRNLATPTTQLRGWQAAR